MSVIILIAEDDRASREMLKEAIGMLGPEGDYEVVAVPDGNKAWEFISESEGDAILAFLDQNMPGLTGLDILKRIKESRQEERFICAVIVTGAVDEELLETKKNLGDDTNNNKERRERTILAAKISNFILAGAKAVIRKPVDPVELVTQIKIFEEALKNSKSRESKLRRDPLTKFYNQIQGKERLEEEIVRCRRNGAKGLAFVFVDLDDFKSVNDEHGHLVGSEILRIIAERIAEQKRDYDVATRYGRDEDEFGLTRYGGDEFTLMFPDIDMKEAQEKAIRICDHIAQPIRLGRKSIKITASVGVAMLDSETRDADTLISRADDAAYESKRKGKNQVTIWNSSIPKKGQ